MEITIKFEVPDGTDRAAFVEAMTKLIHEGEENLSDDENYLITMIEDVDVK